MDTVCHICFRFYGEAVVEACVEVGAHHIDISGEPAFLEKVQLKYHQKVPVTARLSEPVA